MAENGAFWSFVSVLRQHWFAAMSGGFSVPFTAAAVYFDNRYAQGIFGSLAIASLCVAAYRIWKSEHDKVVALEVLVKGAREDSRNVGVGEAIAYITFREWGLNFLHAVGNKAPFVNANKAYDQFLQSLADGYVPSWGKRQDYGVYEPIPKKHWFDDRIDFLSLGREIAKSEGKQVEGYRQLMTSREAVESYWPPVGSTGPRSVSALQITFGMDHAYKGAKLRNLHQYERILSFKVTNRGPKTLSECRVIVDSVDVDTGIVFPQTIAKEIRLAPGDHVFVPLVSYGEPMNKAVGDTGDSFTCLLMPEPKPFFDVGENVSIKLLATGIDTLPHEAQCRMWIDENGKLQIQGK